MSAEDPITRWRAEREARGGEMARRAKALRKRRGPALDRAAAEAHTEAFTQIDCLDCGNCCATTPPIVNATDARRLARHLRMGEAAFAEAYLRRDEDGDTVMAATPCPFLGPDRLCAVYEARPRACRAYPHTDTDFSKHLGLHARNLPVCPAVWMVVERLTEGLR